MELLHPVYEFRPLPEALRPGFETYRFADGRWLPDDGEYDLAFVTHNICWMVDLPHQRNILWSWLDGHWTGSEPRHPRMNPWHYSLRDGAQDWGGNWDRDRHPNAMAGKSGMDFSCAANRCANGRSVRFELGDKHIAAGLLRERESKRVVEFPDDLSCMYCGDNGHASLAKARIAA